MQKFSILSQFESARVEVLEIPWLVEDIVHCTKLELVPAVVDAALQTIAHLSEEPDAVEAHGDGVDALKALLTPKLDNMLKDELPKDLLIKLNSNSELLDIIWNSLTRAELLKFVD
ncbi:hypothetical protein L6452_01688 [Arctium lappa]|uniref:Uncharacterized protein n=1 Tax=Arctium lappa TaxID=4217 RepID=A0ACB9FI73_ARCLA|nr:hypothetical protein L6452_01688 [Arctium lappa]